MPYCQLCRGSAVPTFMAGVYRMYRCTDCCTSFVSPTPSNEELSAFYQQFHLTDEQGGIYDQMEGRMQADFPAKVNLVQTELGKSTGRVLDVGCGKGYFVKACCDSGLDAQGCDLSASGVQHATQSLGVRASAGLISELKSKLGTFDVVTFWATIEHVPNPVEMLEDIFELLNPGGSLLLDTGIGNDWLDRTLPGAVQWYDPPQHLWVFSEQGLRQAVEKAGFAVTRFDPNFERSRTRRFIKSIRNNAIALGLRTVATAGRIKKDGFQGTRFPLGNLQSLTARRPA